MKKIFYLLITRYFHLVIFYSSLSHEKLKPTVVPQIKKKVWTKRSFCWTVFLAEWVLCNILSAECAIGFFTVEERFASTGILKRVFWHEFLISPPWAKFVFTCTGHQICHLQFILRKVREEIYFLNSVILFILYWQITCNNLDVIELPLPVIPWVLLVAFFGGVDLISVSISLSFSNSRREGNPHWSTCQLVPYDAESSGWIENIFSF